MNKHRITTDRIVLGTFQWLFLVSLVWCMPLSSTAQISLYIGPGTTVSTNTGTLQLSGDWSNEGIFEPESGRVIFNGQGNQTITGANGEIYHVLSIDKPGGALILGTSTEVYGDVELINGVLDNSNLPLTVTEGARVLNSGGSLAAPPQYTGSVEIIYAGMNPVATGNELPPVVDRVTIDNLSGVTLNSYVTVNNLLILKKGDLDLNGQVITLGPVATLQETPGNTVTGTHGFIMATRELNAPSGADIAGLGVAVTSTANLGNTLIRRGHTDQTGSAMSSIKRYFDIKPTNNTDLNAVLVMGYDESELNTFAETDLGLFRSEDEGINWTVMGGVVDANTNTITLEGIAAFSRWTAGIPVATNPPPAVGTITVSADLVAIHTSISARAVFTDTGGMHGALWEWGDGGASSCDSANASSSCVFTDDDGSDTVTGNHTYTTTGVFTVILTVTDEDGASGQSIYQYIVVYDPDGGFVTGGGWIDSPAGAYVADPTLTGKATFGFVAKYKKGKSTPDGQTQFQFKVADLNFHSSSYDWLVIAGPNAKYKGVGTINGGGSYGFMLTACDAAVNGTCQDQEDDTFRIKIWDKNNDDDTVYDNQMDKSDDSNAGTVIGGGDIKIHSGSGNPAGKVEVSPEALVEEVAEGLPTEYALAPNYPNPFNPTTTIRFALPEAQHVRLFVYDLMGRKVAHLVDGALPAGWHEVPFEANRLASGVYLYRIEAGAFTTVRRMLLVK